MVWIFKRNLFYGSHFYLTCVGCLLSKLDFKIANEQPALLNSEIRLFKNVCVNGAVNALCIGGVDHRQAWHVVPHLVDEGLEIRLIFVSVYLNLSQKICPINQVIFKALSKYYTKIIWNQGCRYSIKIHLIVGFNKFIIHNYFKT